MNQRDQNRYERHRSERDREEPQRGGDRGGNQDPFYQGQGRYGAMPEGGRGEHASHGFTDTYNPEPQWLRDDDAGGQRYGQPIGRGDYDRNDEDYRGGRYSLSEQDRGGDRDEGRYGPSQDRQYGARQQHSGRGASMMSGAGYGQDPGYGQARGYGERSVGRWSQDQADQGRGRGAYGGSGSRYEEARHSLHSRFGSSGAQGDAASYRESQDRGQDLYGAEYGQRGSRAGQQFASDYGGGGYDQVPGGLGYRGGHATGDYPSGVQGPRSYRGLGPQAYKRSDDRIRDDVCERLTDDDRIDASNISIEVNQGAVTLSGSVPERRMRYAAEDLVDDAMGVESINNQLRVQSGGMSSSGLQGTGAQSQGGTAAPGNRAPSGTEQQKH